MNPIYSGVSQRQNMLRPRPRGFGMGYFLMVLLSIASILGATYGFKMLSNLPFTGCLLATSILCLTKMYFLRYQPVIEPAINSGWDRVVGYTVITIISISLAALGVYCYGFESATISTPAVCSLGNFLGDTFRQDSTALQCWVAPLVIELVILILALFNRSRYQQYYVD
jgi:hypothetical protein